MSGKLILLPAVAILSIVWPGAAEPGGRGTVIEDFEAGTIELASYPGQDQEPGAWELETENTFAGSDYALRIHGNSWKIQEIAPTAIVDSTVWHVAVYLERLGEMQALGVSDGTNELLYTFGGAELPQEEKWWTVYQGANPIASWYAYLLPIGEDWQTTYGYTPVLEKLIYVNDDDNGATGITLFDEILDVTADLPVAPTIEASYTVESSRRIASGLFRVGIQFHLSLFDPDSDSHSFLWDFGDGASSEAENPVHEFLVEAENRYTVGVIARDEGGFAGHDTCQVRVDPGLGDLPFTMNFVGDIFTGRSYENPGGLIDTYGIDALFDPTYPIFGGAADVSVANLECSYTDRGTPHPTKSVVFRSRPENIVGIRNAGVDVVTIGNNHIIDYGVEGLLQTQVLLDSVDVRYSGAGINSYFALQPTFWTEDGVRVALLGQCNRTGRQWNYQPFLDAGYSKPGFAYLLPGNLIRAVEESRDRADVVIVQTHSGDEYQTSPPPGAGAPALPPVGTAANAPPPVEAAEIGPEDPDFQFRVEPTPGERELRRMALDLGADILINHHPHVLQGFEVHNGKLIAHSLGNFVFDLYYPETMPTMVLTLEIDKDGIVGQTLTPAWIDDYIPRPATGRLGREILDRIADYSRPMGALVAVDRDAPTARIYLARTGIDSVVTRSSTELSLVAEEGYGMTPPLETGEFGNLSQVLEVSGANLSQWEVRWGREILWHGGFEEEGATFWDDNTEDEWLDDTESYRGERSLALRRHATDEEPVGTDLEKHLPCDPTKEHSCSGWMKASNAADAVVMTRFYDGRYSTTPITSTDDAPRMTGSQDWVHRWKNLETPPNALYFELRCSNDAPPAGTGFAWFDELGMIEWETWESGAGPLPIASPNNYRFLQIRTPDSGAEFVTVTFEETAYGTGSDPVSAPDRAGTAEAQLRNLPNPFHGSTRIVLEPGTSLGSVPARVDIFDARGRRVVRLLDGPIEAATRHVLEWDGRDDHGVLLPSGIYFSRAEVGAQSFRRKLILIR